MKNFLDKLNTQQRQAATITNGYELMLAGAGTGKTHTLITRVANLIAQGAPAHQILLLTFTNKAAGEMRDRLVSYVGETGKEVTAMTFHSFVLKMFREYGSILQLPDYRILDNGDDEALIRSVRKTYFEQNHFSKKQIKEFPKVSLIQDLISASINQQVPLSSLLIAAAAENETLRVYINDVKTIITNYKEEKRQHFYLTFDDMLDEFVKLLRSNKFLVNIINKRYHYVMCDEYQDTNSLQEEILQRMTQKNGNLCVVGDDNQSIYKFRSANIENILSFAERYPNCQVIPLTQNYRSTQEILDVSNQMMHHATEGIAKELVGQDHGKKPKLVSCDNDNRAAKYIVNRMLEFEKHGIPRHRQAVLIRKAAGSTYLEQECAKQGIIIKKYGGKRFVEKKNVKIATSYLRLVVNDKDELAWRMILLEYPGIGAASIAKLMTYTKTDGIRVVLQPQCYLKNATKIAASLLGFQLFWTGFVNAESVAEKIDVLESHYKELLKRQIEKTTSDKEEERLTKQISSLHEEMNVLRDMAGKSRSVSSFLDNLVLDAQQEKENENAFTISTIHSAKGLEWDVVYLLHPVDEVFLYPNHSSEEEAEERRIMYVALTRAKKRLELVWVKEMMLNGQTISSKLSSFLKNADVMSTMEITKY